MLARSASRRTSVVPAKSPRAAKSSTVPASRTSAPTNFSALERTLGTLLAPLEHTDWQSWQRAVHGQLLELTGADSLCLYTPLADGQDAWLSPHLTDAALCAYARQAGADAEWDVIEAGFRRFAAVSGDGVAHESELLSRGELEATPFYREFLHPNRILDLTVAGVSFGGNAPARMHFANSSRRSAAEAQERRSLVRTILPAFRSSLAQWRQLGERRNELGRVLDVLPDAIMLFDTNGTLVHANPAAVTMMGLRGHLNGNETNALQIEAQRVAWGTGSLTRRSHGSLMGTPGVMSQATTLSLATREIKVDGQQYTLRGSLAPAWMLGRDPGVIVTVEVSSTKGASDADLRERYGLTARETEVARYVASGLSNQALADKLGVSFFTARNHVERLMGKMGAMNRAHIGALVRGDTAAM